VVSFAPAILRSIFSRLAVGIVGDPLGADFPAS